jgi:hypothetical protein
LIYTYHILGAATTAVRDQVLRHNPQTGVFCGSYINEKIRFIVQDAMLDQPTDAGLLRAFTHMSLTCDPRALKEVPEEVLSTLPPDPEIVELIRERKEIKRTYWYFTRAPPDVQLEAEQLRWKIDSLQKKRDRAIKSEYRRDYFERIHDEEMVRQLSKVPVAEYIEPVIHHQLLERTQLQEVMCDLTKGLGPGDAASRRAGAIDLMTALSYRREVQCPTPSSKACSLSSLEQALLDDSFSEDPFPLVCKKTQCIRCIGDVRSTIEYRTRTFTTPHKMMNHVDNHLKGHLEHERVVCLHPKCVKEKLVLNSLEQFKLHVAKVHKINLRP